MRVGEGAKPSKKNLSDLTRRILFIIKDIPGSVSETNPAVALPGGSKGSFEFGSLRIPHRGRGFLALLAAEC